MNEYKQNYKTKFNDDVTQVFGYQLLLDLYDCTPEICDDLSLNYEFLDKIISKLNMEKQAPPNIFRSDSSRYPDKAGLSGWAPLIDSSVVIHTLSKRNFISIDIYCCHKFDIDTTINFVKCFYKPKRIQQQYIYRGVDYFK